MEIIFLLFLYFLPSVIALSTGCRIAGMVVVCNLIFGWTLIGWGVALVMAFAPASESNNVRS